MTSRLSRRDFLTLSAYVVGTTYLAACGINPNTLPTPTLGTTNEPALSPTAMPTIRSTEVPATRIPPTPDLSTMATAEAKIRMQCPRRSVEDIVASGVKIASPISEPSRHATDMAKYNSVLKQDILPNYTGQPITPGQKQIGIGVDRIILKDGAPIDPVATCFFTEGDNNYVVVTLPAQDTSGLTGLHLVLDSQQRDRLDPRSRSTPNKILASMPGKVVGRENELVTVYDELQDKNLKNIYETEFSGKMTKLLGKDFGQRVYNWAIGGQSFDPQDATKLLPVMEWYKMG
jgi:hypothetical protein